MPKLRTESITYTMLEKEKRSREVKVSSYLSHSGRHFRAAHVKV